MKQSISPKRRYPSGQITEADTTPKPRETPEQLMALARAIRIQNGATEENYRDQRHESPLGKLRLLAVHSQCDCEGLSEQQFSAIKDYIRVRHRYRTTQGFPRETPKALELEMVFGGVSSHIVSDEEVGKASQAYTNARSALLQSPSGPLWCRLMDGLATDEARDWVSVLGEVRMAANTLARHFGYFK